MLKIEDLQKDDKVLYIDGETCLAKVTKIDKEKEIVHFIDTDGFEWEEKFKDIPETVIKKVNKF